MTILNGETLGRRIARLRLQHAMTQERLANIVNVSAQAVSKWENDLSYPDIMLLPVLAETFGVTVDELLGIQKAAAPTEQVPVDEPAASVVPDTEPIPTPEPDSSVESNAEPIPMAAESAPESEVEHAQMPQVEPENDPQPTLNETASRIRLHVIRKGREAVNLALPLAAARIAANVLSYVPDRLIEGVDLASLAKSAEHAGTGTLIDVDDGADHVTITLE